MQKIQTFVSVLGLLISTLGEHFPRAWLEPHAHTRGPRKAIFAFWGGLMWVGSALSQDVGPQDAGQFSVVTGRDVFS